MKSLIQIQMLDTNKNQNQENAKKRQKTIKNVLKKITPISLNEIKVKNKICEIPNFFLYFDVFLNYRNFKLAEIDDEKFEKCDIVQDKIEYYLFQYENQSKLENLAQLLKELSQTHQTNANHQTHKTHKTHKKIQFLKIIDSFKYLLKTINLLNEKSIIHLNIVPQSILFKEDNTMLLTNFENSFVFSKNEIERNNNNEQSHFSLYNPKKIHLPIEYHLLCFINERKYDSLSAANIETVANDWFMSVSLSPLKKYISEEYKKALVFSQKSLINKPKNAIKQAIIDSANTWNNYSLNIVYLFLISCFNDKLYSHRFVKDFSQILLQNIFEKRDNYDMIMVTKIEIEKINEALFCISHEEWKDFLNNF